MTIDTQIRHVTRPDANLFAELGFRLTKPRNSKPNHNSKSTTPAR